MEGRATVIGPDDLAMDPKEGLALVGASGAPISEAAQRELIARTEGWPAGIQLAVLAARSASPIPVVEFSGRDRNVAEYFREQVTAWLPDELRDFLVQTAVLTRMCGSICDFVLDRTDSGSVLEELAVSGNAFIQPLDNERCWYRYHELFRDALRAELDARDSSAGGRLLARASEWCEEAGDIDAALRYAVEGLDFDRATALASAYAFALAGQGRNATVGQWLELIGAERIDASATLSLVSAWHVIGTGDTALLDRRVAALDEGGASLEDHPNQPELEAAVAAVRLVAELGDLSEMNALADKVRALGRTGNPWWPVATMKGGVALAEGGDPVTAGRLLVDAERASAGQPHVAAEALAFCALLAIQADSWHEAEAQAVRSHRLVVEHDLENYTPMALPHAVMALVDAHSGRHEDAESEVRLARRLLARFGSHAPRESTLGLCCVAWAHELLGDSAGARAIMREVEPRVPLVADAPMVSDLVARVYDLVRASGGDDRSGAAPHLTAAELRVLEYLPSHRTLQEIGDALFVSRSTTKTHTLAIYRKLGVTRRGEAVERAYEFGLIER